MSSKSDNMRAQWIAETQMFQRIANVPESTDQDLGLYWDYMKAPQQKRALSNVITNRAIQDASLAAAKTRTN